MSLNLFEMWSTYTQPMKGGPLVTGTACPEPPYHSQALIDRLNLNLEFYYDQFDIHQVCVTTRWPRWVSTWDQSGAYDSRWVPEKSLWSRTKLPCILV